MIFITKDKMCLIKNKYICTYEWKYNRMYLEKR